MFASSIGQCLKVQDTVWLFCVGCVANFIESLCEWRSCLFFLSWPHCRNYAMFWSLQHQRSLLLWIGIQTCRGLFDTFLLQPHNNKKERPKLSSVLRPWTSLVPVVAKTTFALKIMKSPSWSVPCVWKQVHYHSRHQREQKHRHLNSCMDTLRQSLHLNFPSM